MKNIKYIISLGLILCVVSLSLVFQSFSSNNYKNNTAFSLWPFDDSSDKDILSYSIRAPIFIDAEIRRDKDIILVDIPWNIDVADIKTVIKTSPGAKVWLETNGGKLVSSDVNVYIVQAEDNSTKAYKVVFLGKPEVELPIKIATCQDLQDIKYNPSGDYYLDKDIDCLDTMNWNDGYGFEPIKNFSGIFNGDTYKIKNLFISRTNTNDYVGLFSNTLSGSVIYNLGIENIYVKTGPLLGSGSAATGGLVGYNAGNMYNISITGSITSKWTAGGLVGMNQGKIENSHSTVDVIWRGYYTSKTSYPSIGGLVGKSSGNINNSYSKGNVDGYMKSFIRTYQKVGGLVGEVVSGGMISSSYSTGKVNRNYPEGKVDFGGLVGYSTGTSTINSFWDINTSGVSKSYGGVGKTTPEMRATSTYNGWDSKIWNITGDSYPSLR